MMKIAFWLTGVQCSGKSFYAKKVAKKLNTKLVHLDTVEDKINIDGMSKEDGYRKILNNIDDLIVIEGSIPFWRDGDIDIIKNIINEYKIIYVLVEPSYKKWCENIEKRKIEIPTSSPVLLAEDKYIDQNERLKKKLGRFLTIKEDKDLDVIHNGQILNLRYQHSGFTDIKWKQLSINPKGKTVLDLGCSSCMYEKYFMENGATKYQGLDVNFSYLINRNARLFDLNNLEEFNEKYDIVVCSSVFHYIHDKEKFIRECARITNELFVFELPLSEESGKQLLIGSRNLFFSTEELTEEWISKYFKSFKYIGKSIVEDGSFRKIYHCFK